MDFFLFCWLRAPSKYRSHVQWWVDERIYVNVIGFASGAIGLTNVLFFLVQNKNGDTITARRQRNALGMSFVCAFWLAQLSSPRTFTNYHSYVSTCAVFVHTISCFFFAASSWFNFFLLITHQRDNVEWGARRKESAAHTTEQKSRQSSSSMARCERARERRR